MATWHQLKAGLKGLYDKPAKGHKVVVNHHHALAYCQHYARKRDAMRFAKRTGGMVISAK